MIEITPNQNEGWAEATIHGKIEANDFDKIAPIADELIAEEGMLNGILLNATEFTGWENLHALLNHLKFVKHHHRFIKKVALVGNKRWQEKAPKLVSIFVEAEIQFFPGDQLTEARKWVGNGA